MIVTSARRKGSRSKYGAVKTVYDGETYDSKAEADYARYLDLMVKADQILRWNRGTAEVLVDGPSRAERITYRPDFLVWNTLDGPATWAVDVKGVITRDFRLRAILWKRRYPYIPLKVVNGKGQEIDIFKPRKRRPGAMDEIKRRLTR